ncbi:MAG: OsmC family protein [Rhodanobacteraceae bacterium]
MSDERTVALSLEQVADYEFRVRFDGSAAPELTTDESAPLGREAGPDPAQLQLAAVANCLSSSLLFALRKFKNSPESLRASAQARMARNQAGRWRIVAIDVSLSLAEAASVHRNLDRALAQFEEFCIVTESVRTGIPVRVHVNDSDGALLHSSADLA